MLMLGLQGIIEHQLVVVLVVRSLSGAWSVHNISVVLESTQMFGFA